LKINWQIAKNASINTFFTLCVFGFVGVIAFIVNSKPLTMIPSILFIAGLWYLLYRLEIAWRENRLRFGWYK